MKFKGQHTISVTLLRVTCLLLAAQFIMAAKTGDHNEKHHDSAVVRIHTTNVPCGSGLCAGHGSGFLINSQGYVVTNHHVIQGVIGHEHDGYIPDGSFHNRKRFTIVWSDQRLDLAIIRVRGLDASRRPLTLAEVERRPLKKGTKIWTSGFPGVSDTFGRQLDPVRKDGVLSAYRDIRGGVRVIEHDAATNPGNSGGPVSDLCGRVVAVTSIGIRPGKGVGTYWSIRISEITDELRRRNIRFKLDSSECDTSAKTMVIKKTTVIKKVIKGERGQQGEKGRDAPLWLLVVLAAGLLIVLLVLVLMWRKMKARHVPDGMSTYVRREVKKMMKGQGGQVSGSSPEGTRSAEVVSAESTDPVASLVGRNHMNGVTAVLDMPLVLGRGKMADVKVSDDGISRQHSRIGYDARSGKFWLEDLGSVNGTWLEDGTQVMPDTRVTLVSGDGFYLGNPDYSFRVLVR